VYSTPDEDARDFLAYEAGMGSSIYDRDGLLIDGDDLWDDETVSLSDLMSWTITGTQKNGTFSECPDHRDGGYPAGGWPICQYCDTQFRGASSDDDPFNGDYCLWTGSRSVLCMGTLP
jgi:hypothetical protein